MYEALRVDMYRHNPIAYWLEARKRMLGVYNKSPIKEDLELVEDRSRLPKEVVFYFRKRTQKEILK